MSLSLARSLESITQWRHEKDAAGILTCPERFTAKYLKATLFRNAVATEESSPFRQSKIAHSIHSLFVGQSDF